MHICLKKTWEKPWILSFPNCGNPEVNFLEKVSQLVASKIFQKLISQLWGIPQPQYFITLLSRPHWTYFWKHDVYYKKDTEVGSQNLATKFGFVPDWL